MGKKTTVLMILDGFGINEKKEGNAILSANTPNIDKIQKENYFAKGQASGLFVGLPDGQMGNSEVGHLNMGAGRIVYQDLTKITKAIHDGDFFENTALKNAMENCTDNKKALHIMGLLSNGGVHSHNEHLYGLLKMAKMNNIEEVYIHAFLDGRDTPPTSAKGFLQDLQKKIEEIGIGKLATISGRYYAMDRDNRWDRVAHAYDAIVMGKGGSTSDVLSFMEASYKKEVNDEFIEPTVIMEKSMPVATVKDGDSVIFFNYRPDRARELTRAFCDEEFSEFERGKGYIPLKFTTFTDYDATIKNKEVAFKKGGLKNTLGEYISNLSLSQLRIAETEKYAHVTFFFNGGVEEPYKNEDRILIPSPKVATYDLAPEMSSNEVTKKLTDGIESGKYDLIIVNYANPDMVGHTGKIEATIKAIEQIDKCVDIVTQCVIKNNAQMFICADHGNADQLIDYTTGNPFTAHTTNPVPFIIVNCDKAKGIKEGGKLADIAPTLLDMMGLDKPEEMTGDSLLIK